MTLTDQRIDAMFRQPEALAHRRRMNEIIDTLTTVAEKQIFWRMYNAPVRRVENESWEMLTARAESCARVAHGEALLAPDARDKITDFYAYKNGRGY